MIRPADKEVTLALGVLEELCEKLNSDSEVAVLGAPHAADIAAAIDTVLEEVEFLRLERMPLQTIRLCAGDAIILHYAGKISKEQADCMKAYFEDFLGKLNLKDRFPVAVLDEGVRVSVIESGTTYEIKSTAPQKPEPPPLRYRKENGQERE